MNFPIITLMLGFALVGCVSVEQVVPPNTPSADLTASTNLTEHKNMHVRYWGVGSCTTEGGKLIAMLNSAAIGVDGGNPVSTKIPANGIQLISILGLVPLKDPSVSEILLADGRRSFAEKYKKSVRERFIAIDAKPGHHYFVKFDFDGNDINLTGYEKFELGNLVPLAAITIPSTCTSSVKD